MNSKQLVGILFIVLYLAIVLILLIAIVAGGYKILKWSFGKNK